jgi:hypothetical protein
VQINLTKILKMAKAHHRGQDAEIDWLIEYMIKMSQRGISKSMQLLIFCKH